MKFKWEKFSEVLPLFDKLIVVQFDEYVEVTHNGDKEETYVDIYNKALNVAYTKDTTDEIIKGLK